MRGVHYLASRYNNSSSYNDDLRKGYIQCKTTIFISLYDVMCVFMIRSNFMPPPYFALNVIKKAIYRRRTRRGIKRSIRSVIKMQLKGRNQNNFLFLFLHRYHLFSVSFIESDEDEVDVIYFHGSSSLPMFFKSYFMMKLLWCVRERLD